VAIAPLQETKAKGKSQKEKGKREDKAGFPFAFCLSPYFFRLLSSVRRTYFHPQ
jgi:hypothetical protein